MSWTIAVIIDQSMVMLQGLPWHIQEFIANRRRVHADKPFNLPAKSSQSLMFAFLAAALIQSVFSADVIHAHAAHTLTVRQNQISTVLHHNAVSPCRLFESALSAGGIVKVLRIPNGKAISNARIKTKGDLASKALGKIAMSSCWVESAAC